MGHTWKIYDFIISCFRAEDCAAPSTFSGKFPAPPQVCEQHFIGSKLAVFMVLLKILQHFFYIITIDIRQQLFNWPRVFNLAHNFSKLFVIRSICHLRLTSDWQLDQKLDLNLIFIFLDYFLLNLVFYAEQYIILSHL